MLCRSECLMIFLLLATPLAEAAPDLRLTVKGFQGAVEKAALEDEEDWRLKQSEAREKPDARGVPGVLLRWMPKERIEILSTSDGRTPHPA
jgi:hypothetical protein